MEPQRNDVSFYFGVLKRRKLLFILPFSLLLVLVTSIVFVLPAMYRSSATILIEAPEVPEELVQSTVTGYIEERLQSISQIAFSRKNINTIINRFDLYSEYKNILTGEELLQKMRSNINIKRADAIVAAGKKGNATIAFTIDYSGKDPRKVLQATNALVSLFLEENLRIREEKTRATYDFLNRQLEQLRVEVENYESKIAQFKGQNYRSLPESRPLNMRNIDRIQKEIDSRQEMLKTLNSQKLFLEGQLGTIDRTLASTDGNGGFIISPERQLSILQNQYISLKATRSPKHPDIIKLKQQISLLKREISLKKGGSQSDEELSSWQRKVKLYESRYSEKHPDLINARKKVAELKNRQGEGIYTGTNNSGAQENPAYMSLKTQIQSVDFMIESETRLVEDLKKKYEQYIAYIEKSPEVEQVFVKLERDYDNSNIKYQETKQKVLAVRQSRELEKDNVSEKLSLIEPPVMAQKPYKPKRSLLLLMGFVFSTAIGVASLVVAEFMDTTVRDVKTLSRVSGINVLGTIPKVETKEERMRSRKKKIMLLIFNVSIVLTGVLAFHFLIMPIDIFIFKMMNKLQVLF